MVQKLNLEKNGFFLIGLIFDLEKSLWKYDFDTFWQTVIHRRIFFQISLEHVDSWSKILLFRTHHLWNSTTEVMCTDPSMKYPFCFSEKNEVRGEVLDLIRISRTEMGAYLCIARNGVQPAVSKRIILNVDCKWIYQNPVLISW